MAKKDIQKTQR